MASRQQLVNWAVATESQQQDSVVDMIGLLNDDQCATYIHVPEDRRLAAIQRAAQGRRQFTEREIALLLSLSDARSNAGAAAFRTRQQRAPGAEATLVSEEELHSIVNDGRTNFVQCVPELSAPAVDKIKLGSICTALAHEYSGGIVIIGLDSSSSPARVVGCKSTDAAFVQDVLENNIHPPLISSISTIRINNHSVIAIDIAPSNAAHGVGPNINKLGYYKLFGTVTALSNEESAGFKRDLAAGYSSDSRVVPGADFLQFCSKRRCFELGLVSSEECAAAELEQALRSSRLLDPNTRQLTRAGLLLTGTHRFQNYLPAAGCYIIRCMYSSRGNCIADVLKKEHMYDDQKLFEGPVLQMLGDTADWVEKTQFTSYHKRLVRTVPGSTGTAAADSEGAAAAGGSRLEFLGTRHRQYSARAIWEILANAVFHRDYDLTGEQIQVWMFPRALEVVVPGDVMPGVGDLNGAPHTVHRNVNVCMRLLRAADPQTGRVLFEGLGSGIRLAKEEQQQRGGSVTYKVQPGRVIVRVEAAPTPHNSEGGADPLGQA